eukprot:Nitzschia sp. Nitz4//scaffold194_size40385//5781//7469//NITZ4_007525-RA/size40385-processed-gene-0.1-mRNA-1//1//CDS//3329540319//6966//frame0
MSLTLLLNVTKPATSFSPSLSSTLLRRSFQTGTRLLATTDQSKVDCLVVGGGISGSSLAFNLDKAGVNVCLTEARDYLGGNIRSHRTDDGFLYEEGPNSFATQPSIVRLAHDLGISDQLVFADESLPPWVNHHGKLHPLPKGKGSKGAQGQYELLFGSNGVLKFALFGDLLSWPGKIRAGIGAFLGHPSPPKDKDETVREWVSRILGEEVLLRCFDPMVSGIYAGNPETLSMKSAFPKISRLEDVAYSIYWNIFGAVVYGGLKRQYELAKENKSNIVDADWPPFTPGNPGSFRDGLSTLPNTIAAKLGDKVKLQWKLEKIEFVDGVFHATFETSDGIRVISAKTLVSTLPAHAVANVLEPVIPQAKEIFEKFRPEVNRVGIYHPPLAAVTIAYPKSSFRDVELPNGFGNLQNLPGFGTLYPRTEGVRTLGTLWTSSLFPGRAPPDYNVLLNYIGGSRDTGIQDLTQEEIVAEVDKGCRKVLVKTDAPPPKVVGFKLHPKAIPQYELGHGEILRQLEEAEAKVPGLWVCGSYRTGVAFPDCVNFGYDHAKVVKDHLDSTSDRL